METGLQDAGGNRKGSNVINQLNGNEHHHTKAQKHRDRPLFIVCQNVTVFPPPSQIIISKKSIIQLFKGLPPSISNV